MLQLWKYTEHNNTKRCVPIFQLTSWLEDLQQELQNSEIADTVEGAEQLLDQFNQQREITIESAINTVSEGENLLEEIR